ncbi:hypothetical protein HAZT_HAZT005393 [Hyalella azteca]|uniref:Histone-lysine N-methyltransferase SETMAR n=1 Tax=Hyalella azteca TaxID=294128 RepID=A0A6A0GQV2_HYAAZ|nr:histone-lysine N-methyltransferase SETMAR [Hyalella azteca]KAA0184827.1 hypothetical protein HAZT_HAZT005393 [Hyalella azteca]
MNDIDDEPPLIIENKEALPGFTAKEQRVIVRYLHHMKTRSTEIHKLLEAVCGEAAAPYKLVKAWVTDDVKGQEDQEEQNKNAYSTATNGAVSPKQTLPTDPALVYRLEHLVNNDRRLSIERASDLAMVTKQTAQHVICDVLGMKKVFERWVPRLWTPEQRSYRVQVAEELLRRHEAEGDEFLERIIVGDETVVYYYTPNTLRRHSVTMTRGVLGVGEKYRPSIEQVGVSFMLYYDIYGLLLAEHVPSGADNAADNYANILKEHLTEAYARKRRGKKLSDCILLHDNTAPHSSKAARQVLTELELEALPHPPASPDFEPHEYWLIPFLRNSMRGATYHDKQVIITALSHHLKHLMECEFLKSIKSLPTRWAQCVDTSGLYVL